MKLPENGTPVQDRTAPLRVGAVESKDHCNPDRVVVRWNDGDTQSVLVRSLRISTSNFEALPPSPPNLATVVRGLEAIASQPHLRDVYRNPDRLDVDRHYYRGHEIVRAAAADVQALAKIHRAMRGYDSFGLDDGAKALRQIEQILAERDR